jgi:hypothetical protein
MTPPQVNANTIAIAASVQSHRAAIPALSEIVCFMRLEVAPRRSVPLADESPSQLEQSAEGGAAQYFVVLHQGEWKSSSVMNTSIHTKSQRRAIEAAVASANKAGLEGNDAQVLVQGENHQFRTEWTYGNDPSPPGG